jgi:hypothetical protein
MFVEGNSVSQLLRNFFFTLNFSAISIEYGTFSTALPRLASLELFIAWVLHKSKPAEYEITCKIGQCADLGGHRGMNSRPSQCHPFHE